MEAKKPAAKVLEPKISHMGAKTFYDNHVKANVVIKADETGMSDAYCITNTKDSTFEFQGKMCSVCLEKCYNVTVKCQTLISIAEIVNSRKVNIFCNVHVPTVQVDGSNDVNIHLTAESLDTKVVTSKSSQVNIHFPGKDKETTSESIPYQFESHIVDGKLSIKPAELI